MSTIKNNKENKLQAEIEEKERQDASKMTEVYGRDIRWMSDESKYELKQAMKHYTREKVLSVIDAEINYRELNKENNNVKKENKPEVKDDKKEEMISIPIIIESKPIERNDDKLPEEEITVSKIERISQLISEILSYFPDNIREMILDRFEKEDKDYLYIEQPKKLVLTIDKYSIHFEYVNKDNNQSDLYEFNCVVKRDEFTKNFSAELIKILTENFLTNRDKSGKFMLSEKKLIEMNLKNLAKVLEDKEIFDKFLNTVHKSFEENDDIWVKNNSQDQRNDINFIRDEAISVKQDNSIQLAAVTTVIVSDIEDENKVNVLYICQNTEKIIYVCQSFKDACSVQYKLKDMEKKPSKTFDSLRGLYHYLEYEYDFKEVM